MGFGFFDLRTLHTFSETIEVATVAAQNHRLKVLVNEALTRTSKPPIRDQDSPSWKCYLQEATVVMRLDPRFQLENLSVGTRYAFSGMKIP